MTSHVLPQALHLLPRNPNRCCALKKLGFPVLPLSSNSASVSRASTSLLRSKFDSAVVPARRRLVPRADSGSEGAEGESESAEAPVEELEPEAAEESVEEATKPPRKPRVKLGEIMGILNKRAIEASETQRPVPDIRTGDIVEIKLEVPENRKRLSTYKGIVMSKQNAGIHTTIRIRRIIAGIGVEIVFPIYSPNIKEIKVVNHRKVKTTSPKKYFVRPNTGVIPPRDSSVIRVTLQAQREYPQDMQCKDKFLLQSTIVPPNTDIDDLPQDTFNKESGKAIEESKLRVVYTSASAHANSEDETSRSSLSFSDTCSNQALQHLRDDRDSAMRQTHQLQQELDMLKRRRHRKSDPGFSFRFALLVGLIGIMVGFLLNLSLA